MKTRIYYYLLLTALMLAGDLCVSGQEFRVASNKMVIDVPSNINEDALNSFLNRYNLNGIGIKEFIFSGDKRLLHNNGWEIDSDKDKNKNRIYHISKPLATSADLLKPLDKAVFAKVATPPNWQKREGNKEIFGVNQFKRGRVFEIHDSVVTFFIRGYERARRMRLAGSFTNWQHEAFPMTHTDSGWIVRVKLEPGKYYYKFIAEDDEWTTDPANELKENDGQGNTNSVFYVTNHVFFLNDHNNEERVFVSGSFNEWEPDRVMMNRTEQGWTLNAFLGEGTYAYHFLSGNKALSDTQLFTSGPMHHFLVKGSRDAKSVRIAGDFIDWKKDGVPMELTAEGWVLDYAIGAGNYSYHVIVDGRKGEDSFLVIGANYTFRLPGYANAKKVMLAGEFNNWKPGKLAMHREGNEWVCSVYLAKGKHLYKFIVDGNWIRDPASKEWEDNDNAVLWINE